MRPPSFGVVDSDQPGTMILRYWSERAGLEHFVIGTAKAAAKKLFDLEIDMQIIQSSRHSDKVEFHISYQSEEDHCTNKIYLDPSYYFNNDPNTKLESVIDPVTFCQAFPFHIIFERDMTICQAGVSLVRVIPDLIPGTTKFSSVFSIVRPHVSTNFDDIVSREYAVFVTKTRSGWMKRPSFEEPAVEDNIRDDGANTENPLPHELLGEDNSLRLKGEMVYLAESDTILYLSSPRILSLDSLDEKGTELCDCNSDKIQDPLSTNKAAPSHYIK